MAGQMKLHLAAPTFVHPGVLGRRVPLWPEYDWNTVVDFVGRAEHLGYHGVWVADHLMKGHDDAILEGWTALSALAASTRDLRLGAIHLVNEFRHAPLLAKMVASLDVISAGRAECFIDPGLSGDEAIRYGFSWPDRQERLAQFDEAIGLLRELWRGEPVDHAGRHYTTEGAVCLPRPRQPDGPRIWMGGAVDDGMLELAARHADVWNSAPGSPARIADDIKALRETCERVGRDPDSLTITMETQALVYPDETARQEFERRLEALRSAVATDAAPGGPPAEVRDVLPRAEPAEDAFVIGTPDRVVHRFQAYRDVGVTEVICWMTDFPSTTTLELLATDVIPRLEERSVS